MSIYESLPLGSKAPDEINVVIEIPRGSQNKYEFDEKSGVFKLDRVLYSPVHYPLDYGFIPATRSQDGDHLDGLIIGSNPLFPGCLVAVRPIGLFKMIDNDEEDFKILAVTVKDPRFANVKDIKDIESSNPHLLKEIAHFFEVYKTLEGKKVKILGWENSQKAKAEIKKAAKAYQKEK